MSHEYRAVQWNGHKRVYDLVLAAGVGAFVLVYLGVSLATGGAGGDHRPAAPVLLLRATAACALTLLHVALCIGPLARLDRRFAPLLYNRRHLGVATFLVALFHAILATLYYGGFGVRNPVLAVLADSGSFGSISGFPFEVLGLAALLVLFVMAATSHDFWLANLTPRVWKALHMLVYGAYGLVVMHVALGALQSERSPVFPALLGLGVVIMGGLHVAAGLRELRRETAAAGAEEGANADRWLDVCAVEEIPRDRAKVVCLAGRERIAVFRHDGGVSAVTNVCAHQGGPLGEGKVVGGCITCPWHGYQYLPASGRSPPPYNEKIATYRVRVEGRRVLVDPVALPPGTAVEPARVAEVAHG